MSLESIASRLELLKARLPVLIGNEIVNFALDNFRKQGFDKGGSIDKWKPRADGSRVGGDILVGKQGGALKRSVRRTRTTRDQVTVGSSLPYASAHNEGETIRVKVTKKSRRFFWAMWYKTGIDYWRGMALTKKGYLTVKMPERRFIGDSKELDRRIIALLEREWEKVWSP